MKCEICSRDIPIEEAKNLFEELLSFLNSSGVYARITYFGFTPTFVKWANKERI